MIDPGHPFSTPYEQLIQSLEDRLRHGVEQPDQFRFVFRTAVTAYELPRLAAEVTRVSGLVGRAYVVFTAGTDYRLANNRIVWSEPPGRRPDDGARVEVEYTYRERSSGLTDFNAGSVVGTLVRAVARELKLTYEQMDQAYRRAFIDVATGVALENVVALVGIQRNPPQAAIGAVTFLRRAATDRAVTIPVGTRVADESGRVFVTTSEAVILPERDEFLVHDDGRLTTADRIAQLVGIWPRAAEPLPGTALAVIRGPAAQPFGADERSLTLAIGVRPTDTLRVRYKPKSVTTPIRAAEPGPEGNVNAGAIIIMPTPPAGIAGVINEAAIDGGRSAEADDQLRERAKHALERAGNATMGALKFAVLDVDGVDGVEVIDHSVDASIPLGEVRVRYAAAHPERVAAEVRAVVERTRAAGIVATPEVIETVPVQGVFFLLPESEPSVTAVATFMAAVTATIEALTIGASLSVRRLSALVYSTPGLADVAEAQLQTSLGPVADTLVVARTQLIRPDRARLRAVLLRSLAIAAVSRVGDDDAIDLRLVEASGQAARFEALAIDVTVVLQASLRTAPDQPPERIGRFVRRLTFTGTDTATLLIQPGDRGGVRPADHQPTIGVAVTAAAYPGVAGVATTITIS